MNRAGKLSASRSDSFPVARGVTSPREAAIAPAIVHPVLLDEHVHALDDHVGAGAVGCEVGLPESALALVGVLQAIPVIPGQRMVRGLVRDTEAHMALK